MGEISWFTCRALHVVALVAGGGLRARCVAGWLVVALMNACLLLVGLCKLWSRSLIALLACTLFGVFLSWWLARQAQPEPHTLVIEDVD